MTRFLGHVLLVIAWTSDISSCAGEWLQCDMTFLGVIVAVCSLSRV